MKRKIYYEPLSMDDYDYFSLVENYSTLLKNIAWKNRRKEILYRDNSLCTSCKIKPTIKVWGQPIKGIEILGRSVNGYFLYEPIFSTEHISLHVHHKLYVLERNPWEYNDNELITLCNVCHTKEHELNIIPVYLTENNFQLLNSEDIISCPRCGGDGYLPQYDYVDDGVCYGCKGYCFVKLKKQLIN